MIHLLDKEPSAALDHLLQRVRSTRGFESRGRVVQLAGLVIESEGPMAAIGEVCRIESERNDDPILAEVVGFRNQNLLLMPLGEIHGLHPGSEVVATGGSLPVPIGDGMKGRVIDGLGNPLDGLGALVADYRVGCFNRPPHPLKRQRIRQTFRTGIKAIDTFTPCGRGQRLGIFAGSGVGKSTLLGMIARQAEADINVIALIGERGREVREFLEKDLGTEGRRKSIVVVATSNEPALARVKGAFLAMSIAEHFREQGQNVLLMMDSITRFATAQREIGLAIGEPPTTRGYTPSVFSLLPQLLERAGMSENGSITGLFNVLVEADDLDDPIADAVRSMVDGHIVLSRDLAMQNHYPAIDILGSVSRLNRDLLDTAQLELAGQAREALATYRKHQDLITIGAYPPGSSAAIDHAIRCQPLLDEFLRQNVEFGFALTESWKSLAEAMAAAKNSEMVQKPAPTK